MAFDLISPSQQDALEALALYRFLTVKQFIRLGISKSESSLRNNTLYDLKTRRYKSPVTGNAIVAADLGRWQKLPFVHHLTEVGADLLADLWKIAPSEVPYPIGGAQFGKQFFHRTTKRPATLFCRLWKKHGTPAKRPQTRKPPRSASKPCKPVCCASHILPVSSRGIFQYYSSS